MVDVRNLGRDNSKSNHTSTYHPRDKRGKPKHIVFIADIPTKGGATNCLVELVDCLHKSYGIECTVCTAQQSELNDRLQAVGARTIVTGHGAFLISISRTWWKKPLSYVKGLLLWRCGWRHAIRVSEREIDFSDVDIIHSNLPRNDLGEELARKHNIPHVCHLRENSFEAFKLISLKAHPCEYLSKNSTALIAVSESVRDNWVRHGVDSQKVRVIYDGISSAAVAASAADAMRREPDPEGCLRVVFLGGYDPVKGTLDVIEAVEALHPDVRARVHVCIYGTGFDSNYGRYVKHIVKCGELTRCIELHGYADKVPQLLSHFDVGLACSRHEAFGRVILDYRAAGLAVVAARAGSFPELVRDGVDGILYDPDAPAESLAAILTRLVEDRSLVKRLTSVPYHIRTERDVASDVMGLYKEILDY